MVAPAIVVSVDWSEPTAVVDRARYVAATAGLCAFRNTAFIACCSAYWNSWPWDMSVITPPMQKG
jgi:hypothetical protein